MNEIRHGLKILSLNDAAAECLCGGWYYVKTGLALRPEVVAEYEKHARDPILQGLLCSEQETWSEHIHNVAKDLKHASTVKPTEDRWSKHIQNREVLRPMIGAEVEVLAIYGRVRRFIVGEDLEGALVEIVGEEWKWCESEYATIKVIRTAEEVDDK